MKLLVVVAMLSVLVVDEAKRDEREVVATNPLMLVVNTPVLVAKVTALLDITLLVALTPFTVVVSVLPLSVVVRELMMFVNSVVTPFTILAKVLVVVESEFELMIVLVPIDPPMFEVKILEELERELVVFKFKVVILSAVNFVIVVVASVDVPAIENVLAGLVKNTLLVLVARVKKLEMPPFTNATGSYHVGATYTCIDAEPEV
jgi:hypothetical protein